MQKSTYFMPEVKSLSLNEEQIKIFHLMHLSATAQKQSSLTLMSLTLVLCLLHLRNKYLSSLLSSWRRCGPL